MQVLQPERTLRSTMLFQNNRPASLDSAFLGAVDNGETRQWHSTVREGKDVVTFKLDTGAQVTAIYEQTYQKLQPGPLKSPSKMLFGPTRQSLETLGQLSAKISWGRRMIRQSVCGQRLSAEPAWTPSDHSFGFDTLDWRVSPGSCWPGDTRGGVPHQAKGRSRIHCEGRGYPTETKSPHQTGTDGGARCHLAGGRTHTMVCRNSGDTEKVRRSTHLCGPKGVK